MTVARENLNAAIERIGWLYQYPTAIAVPETGDPDDVIRQCRWQSPRNAYIGFITVEVLS